MPTRVHSSQLQFTRDGRTLVVAEPDGVTLLVSGGDGRRQIAMAGVHAVAAFADQVWVTTRAGSLIRLGLDGYPLDKYALPYDPDGCLIPAIIGGPAALWEARESVLLLDDLGSLVANPFSSGTAILIAGRRYARHVGPRLSLPAGTTVMLGSAAQIAGGCVIFDGTSLAWSLSTPVATISSSWRSPAGAPGRPYRCRRAWSGSRLGAALPSSRKLRAGCR